MIHRPKDIHPPKFTILAELTWATYQRVDYGYRGEVPGFLHLYDPQPYCQHDSRWATLPLGSSSYTVTTAGCAVTAAAMLASRIDPNITPAQLVHWLNTHNGFTSGGLLHWNKVAHFVVANGYADGLEFVDYHLWRDTPADVNKLRSLLDYGPQIVQVDYHPGGPLNTHFVLATAITPADAQHPEDITIIDPYTGNTTTLLTAYARTGWDLARAVYAVAEFRTTCP